MNNPFNDGSREQMIADALINNDMSIRGAYNDLKYHVGNDPLVYQGNNGFGGRDPLPIGSDHDGSGDRTQKGRTRKGINDVRKHLLEMKDNDQGQGEGQQHDQKQDDDQKQGQGQGQEQKPAPYEAELLLEQINKAREITIKMNVDGQPFDTIGLRPYVSGSKMLGVGISRAAIIDAMTMTWPKETRRDLNDGKEMKPFDQTKHPKSKKIEPMPIEKIEEHLAPLAKKTDGKSAYLPVMISLAKAGVPILQIGPKGTGKTTNAEHLANHMAQELERDMPFGFASMTAGTSPGEFKGRITLDGFLPSLFEDIYENGGVFLFDELDAGDENLLTLLNTALANRYFVNAKGKVINQHKDTIPVAAANTMGLGANGEYTGRNRLDASTLDRWAMGRIRVEFDQNLAELLYWTEVKKYEMAALSV